MLKKNPPKKKELKNRFLENYKKILNTFGLLAIKSASESSFMI